MLSVGRVSVSTDILCRRISSRLLHSVLQLPYDLLKVRTTTSVVSSHNCNNTLRRHLSIVSIIGTQQWIYEKPVTTYSHDGFKDAEQNVTGKNPMMPHGRTFISLIHANQEKKTYIGSLDSHGRNISSGLILAPQQRWDRRKLDLTSPFQLQYSYLSSLPTLKPNENKPEAAKVTASSSATTINTTNPGNVAIKATTTTTTTTSTVIPSRKLGLTAVPTPPSAPPVETNPLQQLKGATPKSVIRKGVDLIVSASKVVVTQLIKLPGNIYFYATHPTETKAAYIRIRDTVKHEIHHYWVGTKLLWADIVTARKLLNKTLEGSALTRRERKQLLRTVSDLFRLIPFSMFVIVPFMEFALPFALRLFPNMLPSTYQDSLKAEENMKRELKSRIAMAQFFQETLEELAKEQKRKASKRKKELEEAGIDGDTTIEEQNESAGSMLDFLKKARNGEMIPPDVIIRYANYFKDDLTLDNMPRMQLLNMCKYMSIQPYGSDSFLRFQLRHKIRVLKEDDQRILWEGIEALSKMELREACQERGMRSTGLSKEAYRRALQEWLNLSVNKDLPIALLIMSRTFFLREEMFESTPTTESKSLAGLADAISGMDKEILNEVILEVATTEEKRSDPDVRKIKLEVLSQQNELIRKEEEAREADTKKKTSGEKVKTEKVEDIPRPSMTEPKLADAELASATPTSSKDITEKVDDDDDEGAGLSTEEMDVISQLITADPVSKERKELERIKAAMKDSDTSVSEAAILITKAVAPPSEAIVAQVNADTSKVPVNEPPTIDDTDRLVSQTIDKTDSEASAEADAATKVTFDEHLVAATTLDGPGIEEKEEVVEDPIIARLKKRVESMVDKIEVQLSETQIKIGDKLHFLDKDRDGILSREEMAAALQQCLKRQISLEEAMEIADEMDGNQDGVFTVDELIKWIDEHKLVTFVMEGRDAEMDRIMESKVTTNQTKNEESGTPEKST